MKMTDADKALGAIERGTKALLECDPEVIEIPDIAGRMRAVETKLGDQRRDWNEVAVIAASDPEDPAGPDTFGDQTPEPGKFGGIVKPKVTGKQYRTIVQRKTTRSYNTATILAGLADAEELPEIKSPLDAILWARSEGVLTLKWSWTKLQKAAKLLGLPMRVVQHAIEDDATLGGAWVGEAHVDKSTQEPIPVSQLE